MSFTEPLHAIISYPPEAMETFYVYGYEWIDNLHFVLPPTHFLADPAKYVTVAREQFADAGWEGDGEIGLIWLPPFVFPIDCGVPTVGVVLWHVKQLEDGISWLLSPIELPFENFCRWLG